MAAVLMTRLSKLPVIYLVRHGETEWSLSGRHTGLADIPLTLAGEQAAAALKAPLSGIFVAEVWSSPSKRARRTGELAGFAERIRLVPDLAEWDYGEYGGLTRKEVCAKKDNWHLFRDGCPLGESALDVGVRADRVIAGIRELQDGLLIFSSAHFLRVLAARWLDLPPERGASLVLDTASISILGYEHDLSEPVIKCWNAR